MEKKSSFILHISFFLFCVVFSALLLFILFQAEHCVSAISQILHLNPLHFWKIHTAVFIR